MPSLRRRITLLVAVAWIGAGAACVAAPAVDLDGTGGGATGAGGAPATCTPGPPPTAPESVWTLDEAAWPGPGPLSLQWEGTTTVVNLSLDPDGRVRWILVGYDFSGDGEARWVAEEDIVRILPLSGEDTIRWPFMNLALAVGLAREDERRVTATVTYEGEVVHEPWETGHRCRDHCGDGGYYTCDFELEQWWEQRSP
jgi:hypothetical protein